MKRASFITILVVGFLALLCTTSFAISLNPVSDLSGWNSVIDPPISPLVTINRTGGAVSFNASGMSDGWKFGAIYKSFTGSIGISAEVNISAVSGNAQVGIRKYIAETQFGTRLNADIAVVREDNRYKIKYLLREKNAAGDDIRRLATGTLGGEGFIGPPAGVVGPSRIEYPEWHTGENVWIGLALVGNEVWFYSPGHGTLAKIQILEPFTPIDGLFMVFGFAREGTQNHVEGTVKDISIIYP